MAAGKELTTTVVLNGRATSGFNALSDKITQLGATIRQISDQVGEWEKDSLQTYRNYETYMLEAKGAMSATTESSSELERAYDELNAKAQEWAGNTIFHTNDVAKAISEAAHAGWTYEKMLQGIPRAMILAQAGNTDLSTGLDMLIKTINGTGTAFENSGQFVDQWVMAANSSATTVTELGEAMEKMGATARFGSSTAELLTMLSVLANTGTVGSAAGTLLRNSMIRLVAPTKNAREAMEDLGVEADEISEAVGGDNEALAEANDLLKKAGFSAYTSEGKLKPFLTVFKELNEATMYMTPEERNKVLSAIFPTRTITGAMALLQAAAKNYDQLLEKITDSEGYAQKIAEIQTSGLMGSEEYFKSKWEEFSRKIGEILSEPVESAYDIFGGFLDTLNKADPTVLSSIAGAATAIAAAGPGLMLAGMGMKLFSFLGPWGTALLAAMIGAGALVGYFTKLNQLALENNFGQMALDMDEINTALEGISEEKSGLLQNLKDFTGQFQTMQSEYEKAGQSLAEGLTSKMIAGTTLTEKDKKAFEDYGEAMIQSVKNGINTATAQKMSFVGLLFSTSKTQEDSNQELNNIPSYASLISLLNLGMTNAKSEAEKLSQELRDALTSAFAYDKLTDAEVQHIQSIMNQMNELMSGLNPSGIERNKLLTKSQRVSLESMETFSEEVNAARDATFEGLDEEMLDLQATILAYYDWAKQHGQKFIHPETGELVNPEEVDINALIQGTEEQYQGKRAEWEADYNDILMRGWENALLTSDTGALYQAAKPYIESYRNGLLDYQTLHGILDGLGGDLNLLQRSLELAVEAFGGGDSIENMIHQYRTLGGEENLSRADWLETIYTFTRLRSEHPTEGRDANQAMAEALDAFNAVRAEGVREIYRSLGEEGQAAWNQTVQSLTGGYDAQAIARAFGMTGLDDEMARWMAARWIANGLVENPGQYTATPEEAAEAQQQRVADDYERLVDRQQQIVDEQRKIIDEMPSLAEGSFEYDAYLENVEKLDEMKKELEAKRGQGGEQTLLEQAEEAIENLEPAEVPTILEPDTEQVEKVAETGLQSTLTLTPVIGGIAIGGSFGGNGGFGVFGGGGVPTTIAKFGLQAEGGRATEPSIFAEAGIPEWYIPEAHTQRTADLLKAAAAASGFTWGELLTTNGGLNAGGGISVNIQSYSPTINANNAAGVAEELAKDKERLGAIVKKAVQSAIENMNMYRSIEVYA